MVREGRHSAVVVVALPLALHRLPAAPTAHHGWTVRPDPADQRRRPLDHPHHHLARRRLAPPYPPVPDLDRAARPPGPAGARCPPPVAQGAPRRPHQGRHRRRRPPRLARTRPRPRAHQPDGQAKALHGRRDRHLQGPRPVAPRPRRQGPQGRERRRGEARGLHSHHPPHPGRRLPPRRRLERASAVSLRRAEHPCRARADSPSPPPSQFPCALLLPLPFPLPHRPRRSSR